MEENYFTVVRQLREAEVRADQLFTAEWKLGYDTCKEWCRENPEMDKLRENARRAVEDYYNALKEYANIRAKKITDKIYHDDSNVSIWSKLFKKKGHP